MLIDLRDHPSEIFSKIIHELNSGATNKMHPYSYGVLGTVEGMRPDLRYVVIREVDNDLNLFFYTDERSLKVKSIQVNPNVSLLFYHPLKRVQVRIAGRAFLHHLDSQASMHWKRVLGDARTAYNALIQPGTPIHHPEDAFSWNEDLSSSLNFLVIKVEPFSIEALQLNGLEHLRIRFTKEAENWSSTWLAP
ncbi:pyridoxamine 5'-phosphate oxidase family protein [Cecembia rubra]|uniref:pyridoxamine 5'-phosphate oxidase family protein n=1 Tax=Cecembia rubra TaxID=1485585 RepID=UPI0027155183|nr:pyridoxamine 5'-phosphate oxidase family protein [Cecembia rubra]